MRWEPRSRLLTFWVLNALGWMAYAGAASLMTYRGGWTDVPQLLLFFVPYFGGFLTCIPLRYVLRKIRLHERSLLFFILTTLLMTFLGTQLWLGISYIFGFVINPPQTTPQSFLQANAYYIINGGIPLLGWTSLYFGLKIRRAWKEQERRTGQANSLAQAAQLQMLRYQLNPHFLFNSMNAIRALIDEDEAKAREMITELSEFLRYSLDSRSYANVPLKDEIEAIRHYLAIQKKRYEDKLEVRYELEPDAGEYPVLSFLVHPLIENAIKFGMRTSRLPLVVELRATVRNGVLRIEVLNTGHWIDSSQKDADSLTAGTGTGLDNVRRRLENAYPGRHRFEAFEKDGNVCLRLEIGEIRGDHA